MVLCHVGFGPLSRRTDTQFTPAPLKRAGVYIYIYLVYMLAHGYNVKFMTSMFCVGAFTVQRYKDNIVNIFPDKHKLFARFISIPQGERFQLSLYLLL